MNALIRPETQLAEALGDDVAFRWTGRPVRGLLVRPIDALLIPFSLFWLGFALFWESLVVSSGGPVFMQIWGIPFILLGVFFVVGRFFADSYFRARTAYGVTATDAFIVRSGLLPRTVTFNLDSTAPIEMKRRHDGSGTITFGNRPQAWSGANVWSIGSTREFEGIPNVTEVYRLVTGL